MLADYAIQTVRDEDHLALAAACQPGVGLCTIVGIDEVHTPDSSRYWWKHSYEQAMSEGGDPPALDKEYVRRWLVERGYRGEGPSPTLPDSDSAGRAAAAGRRRSNTPAFSISAVGPDGFIVRSA